MPRSMYAPRWPRSSRLAVGTWRSSGPCRPRHCQSGLPILSAAAVKNAYRYAPNGASLPDERVNFAEEVIPRDHNRIAPRDRQWQRFLPAIARRVQKKCIPECVVSRLERRGGATVQHRRQPRQVRLTEDALFIPTMNNARVGQKCRGPFRACIARIHLEPHGVYTEFCAGVSFEELLLRPPGCSLTRGSRR